MKIKSHLACLFIAVALSTSGFAAMTVLKEPSFGYTNGFPASTHTNMLAALRRPDCKFLGGTALNAYTSLKYSGDTVALNYFLDGLSKCPGATLSICLDGNRSVNEAAVWMVGHNAHQPDKITVYVNLKSSQIKIEKLVIPEIKGPALADAK